MMQGLFFAMLFLLTTLMELTIIHAFTYPWQLFPLLFLVGVILMYRRHDTLGAAWLLFSGLILARLTGNFLLALPMLATGLLGVFLCRRFFSRRSLYGLIGLSLVLIVTLTLLNIMVGVRQLSALPWLLLFTLAGSVVLNKLFALGERWYAERFVVRDV